MRKSRKYISMPIVSLKEGTQIGTVRSLVVDPVKMEIAALIIDQRGWFRDQKIIPFSKVKSIGNDAITIDESSNVQKTVSLPEILKLMKEKANPTGTRVITETGTVVGIIDEYYINEISGKIVSFEISGKMLESLFKGKALMAAEYVRTLGSDVIVVSEDAPAKLEKLDGGLQETFQNIKEGTSSLWESTKQRTIEISKNIKDKYEKKDKIDEPNDADTRPSDTPPEPDSSLDVTSEIEIKDEEILPDITLPAQEPNDEKPADEDPAANDQIH